MRFLGLEYLKLVNTTDEGVQVSHLVFEELSTIASLKSVSFMGSFKVSKTFNWLNCVIHIISYKNHVTIGLIYYLDGHRSDRKLAQSERRPKYYYW